MGSGLPGILAVSIWWLLLVMLYWQTVSLNPFFWFEEKEEDPEVRTQYVCMGEVPAGSAFYTLLETIHPHISSPPWLVLPYPLPWIGAFPAADHL